MPFGITRRTHREASVSEVWFEEDGEAHERRRGPCVIRQRFADGLIVPTARSRSMQSTLLPPANGVVLITGN